MKKCCLDIPTSPSSPPPNRDVNTIDAHSYLKIDEIKILDCDHDYSYLFERNNDGIVSTCKARCYKCGAIRDLTQDEINALGKV